MNSSRTRRTSSGLVGVLVAFLAASAQAATGGSHLLVEGLLKDTAGNPLDGTFDITFALYAVESGPGLAVYSEAHVGTVVDGGLFQERLGNTQVLNPALFVTNPSLWLGVTISGQPELPRTPLETNPYSFRALTAAAASSLTCTGCVDAAKLSSSYAASVSPGGAANSALVAETLACSNCVSVAMLQAGVLAAGNVSFDDTKAKLGSVTVQGAIDALKAMLDAGGGGGGVKNEGNGQVASSTTNQWQIGPFASVKDYLHLFNPGIPKIVGYFYGTNTSSFATGNNLAVAYQFTPNQYSTNVMGKSGESVMQVGNPGVFTPGSHILIHQTVGTGGNGSGAGLWELNAVKGVAGSTVQLAKPLTRDYTDAGPSSGQAQAVVAVSYNNLEVLSGGVVIPSKKLDGQGESGGIVYVRAQNVTIRNGGKIHADASGYASLPGSVCPQRGGSECNGQAPGSDSSGTNNCSGGGGTTNPYCAGGGGGNKTAGGDGTLGYNCSQSAQGKGGSAKGVDDGTRLHYGGAGGGNNNWCAEAGQGGGIVVIGATNITIDPGGLISANGAEGSPWASAGGAGGTVALFAQNIVNNGTIEAKGGLGKGYYPNHNGYAQAGNGGEGWVIQKPPPPGIVNEAYPKHVQIWIDGVNVTPSIGDPNAKGAPMYSTTGNDWGDNGLAAWDTGPLDLTNVANWTLGEHTIELKETGGAGGELKSYVYVIYPYSASTPPANDVCATPTLIDPNTQAVVLSGTTEDFMGKTLAKDDLSVAGCGGAGGPDVVYQFTLAQRSLVNAVLVAPFSSKMYLRKTACQTGPLVQCTDKTLSTDPVEAGTYWLVIDSDSPNAKGNFKLAVSTIPAPVPTADSCATAQKVVLSGQGTATITGTTLYANDDTKGLCSTALSGGPDVVYELDAGTGQNLTATLTAPFQSIMYLTTSQCGAQGVPLSCSATGSLTVQGLAGGKYWLVIDGKQAKEWGAFSLAVEVK